ncbi:MAG TPA: hypothetical protein PKY59_04020 [Pyrinomonadaceae bacterium]|nr:hypothetical protein [Pyrinomonadaceae bacterium]
MARYSPKAARERGDRFINSWAENSPDHKWADMTLPQFRDKQAAIEAVEDQISASEAHTKSLKIQRDNMNKSFMEDCDYVAKDVEGDREFGPDSALYSGFGYIRKSERRSGRRRSAPNGDQT